MNSDRIVRPKRKMVMELETDYSFKKPGAIPFKWEIRPGVPKIQQQNLPKPKQLSPPSFHQKLKPPPPGFIFVPSPESSSRSFRSNSRTRSERWRFDQPTRILPEPESVAPGCFPSPLAKRKESKRRDKIVTTPKSGTEPDCTSELETLSRWSCSSRKLSSPFRDSPSSYFSSCRSSPRAVGDAEWAGFGLF